MRRATGQSCVRSSYHQLSHPEIARAKRISGYLSGASGAELLRRVYGLLSLLFEEIVLCGRPLGRNQLDRQLIELASEAKQRSVVVVVHSRAGIHSNVERLRSSTAIVSRP
jgi:hypothetical protein